MYDACAGTMDPDDATRLERDVDQSGLAWKPQTLLKILQIVEVKAPNSSKAPDNPRQLEGALHGQVSPFRGVRNPVAMSAFI